MRPTTGPCQDTGITVGVPVPAGLEAAVQRPDFTVESALRWLGHECPDHRCCAPIDTLRASVWFLRRGLRWWTSAQWIRVLVEVPEIDDGVTSSLQAMHQINGCTSRDAIEVRFQRGRTQGHCTSRFTRRVPQSPLMGLHPAEMPGPSDGDLRAITMASQR